MSEDITLRFAEDADLASIVALNDLAFGQPDEGQIVEQGKPGDVFDNPQNERTQSFLSRVLAH